MNDEQNNNKPFLINNYPTKNEDLNAPTPINQEDNHININQNHINKYGYFTLNPNFYMFLENQQQINIRINSEIKPMSFSIKFLPFLLNIFFGFYFLFLIFFAFLGLIINLFCQIFFCCCYKRYNINQLSFFFIIKIIKILKLIIKERK